MAVTLTFGTAGYDIFINIWQSNNFSSYGYDAARDVGHSRIFQMEKGPGVGVISQVTGEPLSYGGAATVDPTTGPPVGHILAFCRDYYLPNRLQPARKILIIPNAAGGTGYSSGDHWGVGKAYHEDTIVRVNAAMALPGTNVIKACLCQGGEADYFGAPLYFRNNVIAEVADFRARWTNGSGVPFLFGQVSPNWWQPEPKYEAWKTATFGGWASRPWSSAPRYSEAATGYKTDTSIDLENMATYVANSASVSSIGLTTKNWNLTISPPPTHEDWYGTAEYIHFDAESQRGSATQTNPLSKRYWTAYQTLVP